jgi:hypothetical protein
MSFLTEETGEIDLASEPAFREGYTEPFQNQIIETPKANVVTRDGEVEGGGNSERAVDHDDPPRLTTPMDLTKQSLPFPESSSENSYSHENNFLAPDPGSYRIAADRVNLWTETPAS